MGLVIFGSSSERNKLTKERIQHLSSENPAPRTQREIEMEVLAEGREWTRRRLEEKLQQEAECHGGVFPPQRSQGAASAKSAAASAQRQRRR